MGCGASAQKPPEAPKAASTDAPKPAPEPPKKTEDASKPPAGASIAAAKAATGKGDAKAKAKGGYEAQEPPPKVILPGDPKVPEAPPRPCLYYYPFAGRGELVRLIAAVGGVEIDEKADLPDRAPFGSPGGWPCLEHGSLKISQSFVIESYIARIAPRFKDVTPAQRAEDAMFCKIKEELHVGYREMLSIMMADESKKAEGVEDITALGDKWFPIIEGRLPAEGFINGLAFPTVADLAMLNVARGFMPFGAAYLLGGYNVCARFPKFAAHVNRVAAHPAVQAYLSKSISMEDDPLGLREASVSIGDAVEVRDRGHNLEWKTARVTAVRPLQVKVDGWSWSTSWDEVRRLGFKEAGLGDEF